MKMTKDQLKAQHKDDKVRFGKIKGVMVIQARHYRFNSHGYCCLSPKVYNWQVGYQAHNLKWAQVGHVVTVQDKNSKEPVVITKIIDAKGSIAQKMAHKLKYVINFRNQVLRNGHIVKSDK